MILETSNGIRLIDPFNSIPGLRYVICDFFLQGRPMGLPDLWCIHRLFQPFSGPRPPQQKLTF